MNMKKSYQHRKESEEVNKMIIQLQANIRGYLVRREIKNKNKLCYRHELYAIKIQVSCYYFFLNSIYTYLQLNQICFRNGGDVFYSEDNGQLC